MKSPKDPCLQVFPAAGATRGIVTGHPAGESPVSEELMNEMARYSLEEYQRLGLTANEIMALFRDPSNRLLYSMYRAKGESYVRTLAAGDLSEVES